MFASSFHPGIYYGLLAACLLLGLGLSALAWWRPARRQRGLRVGAGLVAAGALWLLAFPPLRPRPVARAEAIVLTEGYAPDTLQRLRQRLGMGTPIWYYGKMSPPAGARSLASLLTLSEQRPALRRLHILGRGLPAAALPLLKNLPLRLYAGPAFSGVRTAFWPAQLALGEMLRVTGTVAAEPGHDPVWVSLHAAGTTRDSVRLPAGGGRFQLHYQPKTAGLVVYELRLRRPGQPLAAEPVPLEITTAPLPAVLLLTATPAFEFKFLKNYLAEAHYPVALRTTVSRDLIQTEFLNQPSQNLDHLTPALLAHYQVLIADAATLARLSATENQALQTALSAGRLGLIVLADAAPLPRATPARADFTILPRPIAAAAAQKLAWPGAPADARAALPAQLRPELALRALVTGPGAALVAAGRRVGLGCVVVSVLPETFRWTLRGQPAVYASFWNQLLTAAGPPAPAGPIWRVGTRWPRPHEPLTLQLAAAEIPARPPTVNALAGGPAVRLALRQDARLPEWSTTQFWPGATGWHSMHGPGISRQHFYVYPATAWAGPEAQARRQAAAQRAQPAAPTGFQPEATGAEPWPAVWFFGLFLLAAGYLWLEEKL